MNGEPGHGHHGNQGGQGGQQPGNPAVSLTGREVEGAELVQGGLWVTWSFLAISNVLTLVVDADSVTFWVVMFAWWSTVLVTNSPAVELELVRRLYGLQRPGIAESQRLDPAWLAVRQRAGITTPGPRPGPRPGPQPELQPGPQPRPGPQPGPAPDNGGLAGLGSGWRSWRGSGRGSWRGFWRWLWRGPTAGGEGGFSVWVVDAGRVPTVVMTSAGGVVAVSRWAVRSLPPRELEAVLAHQIAYQLVPRWRRELAGLVAWHSLPARGAAWLGLRLWPLLRRAPKVGCLVTVFVICVLIVLLRSVQLGDWLGVLGWVVMFAGPAAAPALFRWFARLAERRADEVAAGLGYGPDLLRVLESWQDQDTAQTAGVRPAAVDRIKALEVHVYRRGD